MIKNNNYAPSPMKKVSSPSLSFSPGDKTDENSLLESSSPSSCLTLSSPEDEECSFQIKPYLINEIENLNYEIQEIHSNINELKKHLDYLERLKNDSAYANYAIVAHNQCIDDKIIKIKQSNVLSLETKEYQIKKYMNEKESINFLYEDEYSAIFQEFIAINLQLVCLLTRQKEYSEELKSICIPYLVTSEALLSTPPVNDNQRFITDNTSPLLLFSLWNKDVIATITDDNKCLAKN